jgi:uncharacterized protein (DUF4415 family)
MPMSRKERAIASDFNKAEGHVITPGEYDEIPQWTDEMFERADYYEGGKLVRRGRPRSEHPKVAISIRLSEDVLSRFKASRSGMAVADRLGVEGLAGPASGSAVAGNDAPRMRRQGQLGDG